jgi:putative redox protein
MSRLQRCQAIEYQLTRIVGIEGDLKDDERQHMLEIADRCPVHKTLESKITIKSRLRDGV